MGVFRVSKSVLVYLSALGWIACAPGNFSSPVTQALSDSNQSIDIAPEYSDDEWEPKFAPMTSTFQKRPLQKPHPDDTADEVRSAGFIKPTVYYFPIIDEGKIFCKDKVFLTNKSGLPLIQICQSTMAACALQGSCAIVQNDKLRAFNIAGRNKGLNRFFEMTDDACKFGYGVKKSCLDPFYTVAADLKIYSPGDVIYVPAAAGIKLPNGTKHDGYFVVRDTGSAIKGEGRFDFFSGYYSWRDKDNPFVKIGLASKKTRLPYYLVSGEKAQIVLQRRHFPSIPSHSVGLYK